MAEAHFISSALYFDLGLFASNTDTKKRVVKTIEKTQEFKIKQLIGSTLHDTLVSEILTDTLTADNIILLDDFITPTHVAYVDCELAFVTRYDMSNKGPLLSSSENQSSPDAQEYADIKFKLENDANEYATRMIKFLRNNEELYPDYRDPLNCEGVKPIRDATDVSMWLGDGLEPRNNSVTHKPRTRNLHDGHGHGHGHHDNCC